MTDKPGPTIRRGNEANCFHLEQGGGEIPPNLPYMDFLARNFVFSRRKLALTLLCRTRYVLLYIKTPILEFEICFSIPFSVKIMLKMHQKSFGGRAPPGPAGGA